MTRFTAIALCLLLPSLAFSQSVSLESINLGNLTTTPLAVDTLLAGSYRHHPLYANELSWSELGNTGLPALPNQHRHLRNSLSPLLAETYDSYAEPAAILRFYHAHKPFSLVNYNSGGAQDKNGQTIHGLFARDLKHQGNITFYGTYINSDGHFQNQKSNASTLHVNYQLHRDTYTLIAGLSRSKFNNGENGGLSDDASLIGNSYPALIPVRLTKATSNTTNLAIEGLQSFRIPLNPATDSLAVDDTLAKPDTQHSKVIPRKNLRIDHQFRITDFNRFYLDESPPSGFYPGAPSGLSDIKDSIRYTAWTNRISYVPDTVHIGSQTFSIRAGLQPDLFRYQCVDTVRWGMRIGVGGELEYRKNTTQIDATGHWVVAGWSAGDYGFSATYGRPLNSDRQASSLRISLTATGAGADPVIRYFRSAVLSWNNQFLRQHETALDVLYTLTPWKLDLSLSGFLNIHRVYFNAQAVPAQLENPMVTGVARISKRFDTRVFHSTVTLLAQYASSDIIRLPLLTAFASAYMHHDLRFASFQGLLELEYGLDVRYNTPFKGYSYMPATGVFYLQDDVTVGNYPGLDLFAQIKIKRTRLFAGWFHTFAGLLAAQSFPVAHYPFMRPHFKYGVYWHFYD